MSRFVVEALNSEHDRLSFDCGNDALNRYFHAQVTQDVRRDFAKCFVGIEITSRRVAGYFTLASSSVKLESFPADITKKLPRYPVIPAALIGRFAVDRDYHGQGLGASLIADAIERVAIRLNLPLA